MKSYNPQDSLELEKTKLELEKVKLEQMKLELELERVKQKSGSTTHDGKPKGLGKTDLPEGVKSLVTLSIVFPPIGLFLVWRHPEISFPVKIFLTISTPLACALLIYVFVVRFP